MTTIEDQISKVETKIDEVEQQIRAVEENLKRDELSEVDKTYFRDEKKQLREKEKQLRDEKNLLLARQQPQQDGKFALLILYSCIQFVCSNTEIRYRILVFVGMALVVAARSANIGLMNFHSVHGCRRK
jgi:hypothetical protein